MIGEADGTHRAHGLAPGYCSPGAVANDQTAFVNTPDDFHLLPGAAAAVRRLNEAGIPVVVVTNQGGIALGYLAEDDLGAIHERMVELLAKEGAHVDRIYYCPHLPKAAAVTEKPTSAPAGAPQEHQPGTIARYARECPDRKPGIGMLERARDELGIDLARSLLVGDATTDILAGLHAGCTTILVQTGQGGADGREVAEPDFTVKDLSEAVELILGQLGQGPKSEPREVIDQTGLLPRATGYVPGRIAPSTGYAPQATCRPNPTNPMNSTNHEPRTPKPNGLKEPNEQRLAHPIERIEPAW